MRIAQLVPPWIAVPPAGYGGTERIASYLTEGLVAKGHSVTLFASGDSKTAAKLHATFPEALGNSGELKNNPLLQLLGVFDCFKEYSNFDIIHNHAGQVAMFLTELVSIPVVHTLHGTIVINEVPAEKKLTMEKFKHQRFVSISNNQRMGYPDLNFVATVYNGIPIEEFAFNPHGGNYMAWLGRITPKKGVVDAIEAAKQTGLNLKISAFVDPIDKPFFETEVQSKIDGKSVELLPEQDKHGKSDFLGGARVMLFPITWHEPFGMVMTEAMATGTPVVAYNNGSVPEVIVDGVTGYIVDPALGKDGLIEAVKKIYNMGEEEYNKMRLACRKHVEDNFTIAKMVSGYERVYEKICL